MTEARQQLAEASQRMNLVAEQLRASADTFTPSGHKTFLHYEADTLDPTRRLRARAAALGAAVNDSSTEATQ